MKDKNKHVDDLFKDYMNLCEKYSSKLEIYEFGFAIIQFASKMLMDTAPTDNLAFKTIKDAVDCGISWHTKEQNDE